jgi:hypothetical protein
MCRFNYILAPGSGFRIRIHKVIKSASNPDPDLQPWFFSTIPGTSIFFLYRSNNL